MYNEVTNPIGRKNGVLITVQDLDPETEKGLRCGCVCPNCNAPFEARMGEKRVWHFAHSGTPCDQTMSFVNSIYELVYDAINKQRKIWTPQICARYVSCSIPGNGYMQSSPYKMTGYEIVVPRTEVNVSRIEYIADKQGLRRAIVINDGEFAIRVVADKKYCVTDKPKQYEDLSTLVIDLEDLISKVGIEKLYELITDDDRVKRWINNTAVIAWKKAKVSKEIKAFNENLEAQKAEQSRLEQIRIVNARRKAELEKAKNDAAEEAKRNAKNKKVEEYFNSRNKTKRFYDIISKHNHIFGHMISKQDNGRYEKRVKIDMDITDIQVDTEKNSISIGRIGKSCSFFVLEQREDYEQCIRTGKPYINLNLINVDIDEIESYLEEQGFTLS